MPIPISYAHTSDHRRFGPKHVIAMTVTDQSLLGHVIASHSSFLLSIYSERSHLTNCRVSEKLEAVILFGPILIHPSDCRSEECKS